MSVIGLVPAAGRSRRFAGVKQLHEIDGVPLLLRVLQAIAPAVTELLVVTRSEIRQVLESRAADKTHWLTPSADTPEMIDSLRAGVADLRQRGRLTTASGVLVCPGDLPHLQADDVERCCDAFRTTPDRIVIATYAGRRGHPLILPADLVAVIESSKCDQGLRALPRAQGDRVLEVPCPGEGGLRDVDTREELP